MCLHLGYKTENKWPATLGVGLPAFFLQFAGEEGGDCLGILFRPDVAVNDNFGAGLAQVNLLHVVESGENPGHHDVFPILGVNEVVGDEHTGVIGAALIVHKEKHVAKGVGFGDWLVIFKYLARGKFKVEKDILAGVVEEVE